VLQDVSMLQRHGCYIVRSTRVLSLLCRGGDLGARAARNSVISESVVGSVEVRFMSVTEGA
jgi:hypothetical protein